MFTAKTEIEKIVWIAIELTTWTTDMEFEDCLVRTSTDRKNLCELVILFAFDMV